MFIPASRQLGFKIIKINSFDELQSYFSEHKKYLYYENKDEQYIIDTAKISKDNVQLVIYRNYFQKLGLKGVGDWKNMSEEEIKNDAIKIKKTIEELKTNS